VIGGLIGVVAIAMTLLWPDGDTRLPRDDSVRQVTGFVEELATVECTAKDGQGAGAEPRPCGTATVLLDSGNDEGKEVTVPLPEAAGTPVVATGDRVVLTESVGNAEGNRYAIVDHERGRQLWLVFAAFLLTVLAFGRLRGLTSLLGLGLTFGIVLGFIVPAILEGQSPLLVAVVGCSAIALTVLFLTHGPGRTTTVAVVGTLLSLVLTALLSLGAVALTRLTGSSDESTFVLGQSHGVDLRGLLLAGIMIGSLGVLDDVTVTQAFTVEELAAANPGYGASQLYRAAVRIGRAHIASVINTIVLAYAGASLPLLVLIVALDDPIGQVLSDQLVATELVRSAVGTMGLIAAVPITTLMAAWAHSRRGVAPATTEGNPGAAARPAER
jgi:uncharacterized membrane protein